MSKMIPYYHEVQTLRNNAWVWMLVIVCNLGALVPVGIGMYSQLVEGVPWGDHPMSNRGMLMFFCFIVIVSAVVFAVIYITKLEIQIDQNGVHYSFIPHQYQRKTIRPDDIESYSIRKAGFFEAGIRRKYRKTANATLIKLLSRILLEIRLKNGTRISLGIENPGEVEWALKRLMQRNFIS
jgi:hypothetical protein